MGSGTDNFPDPTQGSFRDLIEDCPLLLITRRCPGGSLFDVVGSIDRDRAALQLVRSLAEVPPAAIQQTTRHRAR
jgi:hypothetical protein